MQAGGRGIIVRDNRNVAPELQAFFSAAESMREGREFVETLRTLLPWVMQQYTGDTLCDAILLLSQSHPPFKAHLFSNWQLAEKFLNAVMQNASPAKRQQIESDRLGDIYRLNIVRRRLIPLAEREAKPIEPQQRIVMAALSVIHSAPRGGARAAAAARPAPAAAPMPPPSAFDQTPPSGARTLRIQASEQKGDIVIPEKFLCPLSGQLFVDPVKIKKKPGSTDSSDDFHYFERAMILQHLRGMHGVRPNHSNPLDGTPLTEHELLPAPEKRTEVEAFKRAIIEEISHLQIDELPAQVEQQIIQPLSDEQLRLRGKMSHAPQPEHEGYQNRIDALQTALEAARRATDTYKQRKDKQAYKTALETSLRTLRYDQRLVKYKGTETFLRGLLNVVVALFTGILPAIILYAATGGLFFSLQGKSKNKADEIHHKAQLLKIY